MTWQSCLYNRRTKHNPLVRNCHRQDSKRLINRSPHQYWKLITLLEFSLQQAPYKTNLTSQIYGPCRYVTMRICQFSALHPITHGQQEQPFSAPDVMGCTVSHGLITTIYTEIVVTLLKVWGL